MRRRQRRRRRRRRRRCRHQRRRRHQRWRRLAGVKFNLSLSLSVLFLRSADEQKSSFSQISTFRKEKKLVFLKNVFSAFVATYSL